jgi:hypothetical protein
MAPLVDTSRALLGLRSSAVICGAMVWVRNAKVNVENVPKMAELTLRARPSMLYALKLSRAEARSILYSEFVRRVVRGPPETTSGGPDPAGRRRNRPRVYSDAGRSPGVVSGSLP